MIGYLKGEVLDCSEGKVLVGVGAPGGSSVGYSVSIPQGASYLGILPGKALELFVYTHVREDALDLYGFASASEKELFLTLLNVNGIGPKVALGILSKIPQGDLIEAILAGDVDTLVKIPGVGKKTAERIVLELEGPMKKKFEAGAFGKLAPSSGAVSAAYEAASRRDSNPVLRDAKEALIGLGYKEQEVAALLKKAFEDSTLPERVEDVIRIALQQLR